MVLMSAGRLWKYHISQPTMGESVSQGRKEECLGEICVSSVLKGMALSCPCCDRACWTAAGGRFGQELNSGLFLLIPGVLGSDPGRQK